MRGWLLDTNVVSELRKSRCDPAVKTWADGTPPNSLYLSRITIAEIRFGIARIPPSDPFRAELEAWLENALRPWFAGRILDVGEDVILTWRTLVQQGKRENYTFAQPDLFIAAAAVVHQLCVVTRNVEDFVHAGVLVLNPWIDRVPRGVG